MDSVHRFLVTYNIVSDHRRNCVARTLASYGDRIQYSVLLIDVKPARLIRLRAALERCMDLREDRALICDLGPHGSGTRRMLEYLGRPAVITGQGPLVL